ncbi:MAG: hypothetical protein ACE3JK_08890 [Sporolactobacillus sp.]
MKTYYVDKSIFKYPEAYQELVELNLVDFDVWYLIEAAQATKRYYDLKKRYPKRNLVPFARRDDNDDIVCFEIGESEVIEGFL